MARWRPDRYGGLRSLMRGSRIPEEVREELEHHIVERTAANMARGMSARAAREDAMRRFGEVARYQRETESIERDVEREARRMEVISTLGRELRQAGRVLRRAPGFTIVAILTLALGMGASAAVYTLLDRAVLSPLPYPESGRLITIDHPVPGVKEDDAWGMSSASYVHFSERARSLDALAVYFRNTSNVRMGESSTQADIVVASANLFSMLGTRPSVGRLFRASDDEAAPANEAFPGAPNVAVISHEYWQGELGGDPDVVGRTLSWEGLPIEIVGVTEPGFDILGRGADIYFPARINRAGPHYNSHYLSSIARLRAGTTAASAQQELVQLTQELPASYPGVYYDGFMEDTRFGVRVRDLQSAVVGGLARVLWIALAAVLLVLVIACANVANLFIVRNETRQNELTIRRALGASRANVLLQGFAEAIMISAVAGALGLWLAYGGLELTLALSPGTVPLVSGARLQSTTVGFIAIIAVLCAIMFAILPIYRGGNWALLREGARGSTASRRQLKARSTLVVAQIALAVVLLAAAGLMLRSFAKLRTTDTGLEADNVLTVSILLPRNPYRSAGGGANEFWQALLEGIASLPGVTAASATTRVPLISDGTRCALAVIRPAPPDLAGLNCVGSDVVAPGYFSALGIEVAGRVPTWSDVRSGSGAIVISRSLANIVWPGADAIGRELRIPNEGDAWYRIVGIAEDVRHEGVDRPAPPMIYYPIEEIEGAPLWGPSANLTVLVRTAGLDPVQLTASIRRLARELEPAAALAEVQTMPEVIGRSMARTSFTMMLLLVAGLMALVLSVVGLYGVVSYMVDRRRAEIGVRMAIGATSGVVSRLIVRDGLTLGLIGVVIGVAVAVLTTDVLRSLLHDVEPGDPLTLVIVSLLLLSVVALASLIPARRAARVDPIEALRG